MIDSHAHLEFKDYNNDFDEVLSRARKENIDWILNVGSAGGIATVKKSQELSKKYQQIYFSTGIHPHQASVCTLDDINQIEAFINDKKCIAIGETGIDLHYDFSERKDQIKLFEKHIDISEKSKLPIIIHCREAFEDVLEIIKNYNINGVFHCFSGNISDAEKVIDLGYYISIPGVITFKNAKDLCDVVENIPNEKILIETDCPFLSPVPFRGRRNEPSYIKYTAQKIAEVLKISLEDVDRITTRNTYSLFSKAQKPNQYSQAKLAYKIRNSLYLNITNKCNLACIFCAKRNDFTVKGHFLKLEVEPDFNDVLSAINEFEDNYNEIVFCGFGEPTLRLDLILKISKYLKDKNKNIKIRINTDGLGNLIYRRNIIKELHGLVDSMSISLNTSDPNQYLTICPSKYGVKAFFEVIDFIKEAQKIIGDVTVTAVELPDLDIEVFKKFVAKELKVKYRLRAFNVVG
ncbi:MAG: YchF/TatD family DNA exonuclease [Pseudomonadota bacterium]